MSSISPPASNSWGRQFAIWLAFIVLDTGTQLAFKWGADGIGDMDFGLAMMAKAMRTSSSEKPA